MIVCETGGDLRALLLELLSGSPAVTSLRPNWKRSFWTALLRRSAGTQRSIAS